MSTPSVSIIMRSFNEAWALRETLSALKAQDIRTWELIVIDSGSTDGSQDIIRAAAPAHFVQITPAEYNPSRVMNHGMRLAKAELCLFLNADATPQGANWLAPLAMALKQPRVAACFSRQIPRPDCMAVFACDYDRCFGPNRESAQWEHFFSMVSSGLHKDVWALRGFREDLQYAEDDEYTRWCKAQNYDVVFVPESVVMHSHNYTPAQAWKRSFGDARAVAKAGKAPPVDNRWLKTVVLRWINDLQHDVRFCARNGRLGELPYAARVRWQQRCGKWAGLCQGTRERKEGSL